MKEDLVPLVIAIAIIIIILTIIIIIIVIFNIIMNFKETHFYVRMYLSCVRQRCRGKKKREDDEKANKPEYVMAVVEVSHEAW